MFQDDSGLLQRLVQHCLCLQLAFADEGSCRWQWRRRHVSQESRNHRRSSLDSKDEWEVIPGAVERLYTCRDEDLGCQLQVECIPMASRQVCPAIGRHCRAHCRCAMLAQFGLSQSVSQRPERSFVFMMSVVSHLYPSLLQHKHPATCQ